MLAASSILVATGTQKKRAAGVVPAASISLKIPKIFVFRFCFCYVEFQPSSWLPWKSFSIIVHLSIDNKYRSPRTRPRLEKRRASFQKKRNNNEKQKKLNENSDWHRNETTTSHKYWNNTAVGAVPATHTFLFLSIRFQRLDNVAGFSKE